MRSAGLALARFHRGDQLLDNLVGRRDANGAIENFSTLPSGDPVEFNAEEKAMFDKSVAAVKSLIDATNKIVGR